MKKMVVVIAWLFSLMAAIGGEGEVVRVKARGIGMGRLEALKDAYRDAVERGVGIYVDAEQLVKNDELVNEQILVHSNAYIEKYEIVKEETLTSGMASVVIIADVRKRALAAKVRDVLPARSIQLSEVNKNLHAQIVSEFKADEDALSIVSNELNELSPIEQLMDVSVKMPKPIFEPIKGEPGHVRLWYPIGVAVNPDKYYKEFAPRWQRILEQIKVAPAKRFELRNNAAYCKAYNDVVSKNFGTKRKNLPGVMTRSDAPRNPKSSTNITDELYNWGMALNEEYNGMSFLCSRILGKEYVLHGLGESGYYIEGWSGVGKNEERRVVERVFLEGFKFPGLQKQIGADCKFCVGLITSAKGQTLLGNLYKIPQNCVDAIVDWQHKTVCGGSREYRKDAVEINYNISFGDSNSKEVAGAVVGLRNLELMNLGCVLLDDTEYRRQDDACVGGRRLWMITPLVGGFARSYVKWVSVDVAKDDVEKIVKATIRAEE